MFDVDFFGVGVIGEVVCGCDCLLYCYVVGVGILIRFGDFIEDEEGLIIEYFDIDVWLFDVVCS